MKMKLSAMAFLLCAASASVAMAGELETKILFSGGDAVDGTKYAVYRIPAVCTSPNGVVIATCDARMKHGGDLNTCQPINIVCRRSLDKGATWSPIEYTWKWRWDEDEQWAASDPSLIVDSVAKKVFLFYNVWECKKSAGLYKFFVQESSDDGKTWSKPRDITNDIAFPEWPFNTHMKKGGFIFISSGSGIQTADGTLLHTIVHVGDGNALFGSSDHGKTWHRFGKPVKHGDECKVVELTDGKWMINSRWRGGGRQIHVTADQGETWESRYDKELSDPQCNAQIMRYGRALLFSNCKSPNRRHNLYVRMSIDDGKTWNDGLPIQPEGAAYSDMAILEKHSVGVIYEGAGYKTISWTTFNPKDLLKK